MFFITAKAPFGGIGGWVAANRQLTAGILIGAAVILFCAMTIAKVRDDYGELKRQYSRQANMEAARELAPDVEEDEVNNKDNEKSS